MPHPEDFVLQDSQPLGKFLKFAKTDFKILLVGFMVSVLNSGGRDPGLSIVLCSWARHFTLTVPLSTQVYKWLPAKLMLGGNPAMDQLPIQGGIEILLVAVCFRNRDKLRHDGLLCRLDIYLP